MVYEKLFLSKQLNLFIDEERKIKLHKHQKDGLRFLYGHYKKNAEGVIINDPSGSGRKVQIVLFLNALHRVLVKPVLVLSDDVHYYELLFHQWTNGTDAVVCNSTKRIPGKRIFLNDFSDTPPLGELDWSIVVVENEPCTDKFINKLKGLRADFKIVVISADLKKDITKFFEIYQWIIIPNTPFSCKDFKFNKKASIKDRIEKAILLDSFYEAVVLRRTNTAGTFKKDEHSRKVVLDHPQKKNKDKSGTKIKRTRKNTNNENYESTEAIQDHEQAERKNKRKSIEHEKCEVIEERIFEQSCTKDMPLLIASKKSKRLRIIESVSDEEMTVVKSFDMEVCDGDQKLADASLLIDFCDSNESRIHSTSVNSLERSIHKNDAIHERIKDCIEMDTHIDELKTKNETIIPEISKVDTSYDTAIKSCIKDNDKVMSSQKTIEVSEDMFTTCDKYSSQTNEMRNDEINSATGQEEKETVTSCSNMNTSFDEKLKALEEEAFKKYKGSILDTHKSYLATGKLEKEAVTRCNKITTSFDDEPKDMEEKGLKKSKASILNPHDESNLANDKLEKDTVTSCNTINTSFDDKLKVLEEKAFKKYKGSILDSIF